MYSRIKNLNWHLHKTNDEPYCNLKPLILKEILFIKYKLKVLILLTKYQYIEIKIGIYSARS